MITIIGKQFPEKVIPLLKAAKKKIDVCVYEWRWYPDQIGSNCQKFNNEFVIASRRGVQIRVVTNTVFTVGVLKENGIDAKVWSHGKIMHVKMLIIDNTIAILGSHNYTMNAFNLNEEISTIFENAPMIDELNNYFKNVWSS